MYYIMNAKNHLTPSARPNINDLLASNDLNVGELTIIIGRRRYGWNKSSPLFVTSHGTETNKAGDSVPYTIDTGNGHRSAGELLDIENVIHVENGKVVHADNMIGLTERRPLWVMK